MKQVTEFHKVFLFSKLLITITCGIQLLGTGSFGQKFRNESIFPVNN